MGDRQEQYPNLKRGGANPGAGRPRKEIRMRWTGLSEEVLAIIEGRVRGFKDEIRKARASGRNPKVDWDFLLKVADLGTRNGKGLEPDDDAGPNMVVERLTIQVDKIYGEKPEGAPNADPPDDN